MVREDKTLWKKNYFDRLQALFDEYPNCLLVGVDNVGSKQMQEIRIAMRGHGEILMGKNTMIRRAIRSHLQARPELERLLPYIVGNIGFVFTSEDLSEIRKKLMENKRGAPAKAGAIAPCDVKLPPQNTGMGPEKTSFFQALQIPTKISRGTIEILNEVHIIKVGEKVGASEAALLNMLNIQPFSYGLAVHEVYDNGTIYSPEVLDVTNDELIKRFQQGVNNIASTSLAVGYPTKASVPHSVANALKNMLAVAAVTDVTFKQAERLKEYLAAAPAVEAPPAPVVLAPPAPAVLAPPAPAVLAPPAPAVLAPPAPAVHEFGVFGDPYAGMKAAGMELDPIQANSDSEDEGVEEPKEESEEPKEESEEEDMGFGLID